MLPELLNQTAGTNQTCVAARQVAGLPMQIGMQRQSGPFKGARPQDQLLCVAVQESLQHPPILQACKKVLVLLSQLQMPSPSPNVKGANNNARALFR